MYRTHSNILCL